MTDLAPFRLEPRYVERIWGLTDLHPWYDWVAQAQPIGEVWLTGDENRVETGPLTGKTLGEVFAENSSEMLGTAAPSWAAGMSPLLLKVIFAMEKLSVQVHPDDRMAQKYGEPRGKTECWYALDAEAGAAVATGLVPGTTIEQVESGVADGTLEERLEAIPVSKGDMIYVDAGTVHAIWPGSVLLETQQNSDRTYRLYDYGRPRELHVAKALEAIRLQTEAGKIAPVELVDRTILIERDYFCVETIEVKGVRTGASMAGAYEVARGSRAVPAYLFAAEGSGRILPMDGSAFEAVDLPTRRIVAIPAFSPDWKIEDTGGLKLVRVSPRWPEPGGAEGAA
jgi:mannose-6-phosphate isomerase